MGLRCDERSIGTMRTPAEARHVGATEKLWRYIFGSGCGGNSRSFGSSIAQWCLHIVHRVDLHPLFVSILLSSVAYSCAHRMRIFFRDRGGLSNNEVKHLFGFVRVFRRPRLSSWGRLMGPLFKGTAYRRWCTRVVRGDIFLLFVFRSRGCHGWENATIGCHGIKGTAESSFVT